MSYQKFRLPPSHASRTALSAALLGTSLVVLSLPAHAGNPTLVPGYVPPVREDMVPPYIDDTRGVYLPEHAQLRSKTDDELQAWKNEMPENYKPLYAQQNPGGVGYENALNTMANGVADTRSEIERIGEDEGLLAGGARSQALSGEVGFMEDMDGLQIAQNAPSAPTKGNDMSQYPSLATGGKAAVPAQAPRAAAKPIDLGAAEPTLPMPGTDGGTEIAIGGTSSGAVDFQHGIVRLKEERISARRALQRMLDQIGGSTWTVVWDLDEVNAGLPDMEISIYAEEPFVKVLNALLARLQTRSGQPLRVIKYEKTQRLVITDRIGGDAGSAAVGTSPDGKGGGDIAVTESFLKEAMVSLHYDEVPLVDALENIVNQAGKGQWRLRMYAGTDQVLKPAHIEEPFNVAIERILKVFNLRYEIFPGGKLIVVTGSDRFGFRGIE